MSASPTASSGSRAQGSPPTTCPTWITIPKPIATASPSPAETRPASATFAPTSSAGPDETAQQPAEDVLVTLRGERAGREHERQERERQRERVALHLRGDERRAATLGLLDQLDRLGGRAQRVVGLGQRQPRVVHEVLDLLHPRRLRQRGELLGGPVQTDHVEGAAEELAVAAVQDQPHVRDVRRDVRALELEIQLVDERLHLLAHPPRRPALRHSQLERRARHHLLQRRDEPRRHGDDRDHLAVGQLAAGRVLRHANEVDVLRDRVDRRPHVERVRADDEPRGQAVLVDEGDARLRVRVAGDETDEGGDHERIREQHAEEHRGPAQRPEVFADEQEHGPHVRAPSTSSSVRSAWPDSSSQ